MLRVHELSFDKMVVGGSLSALKYAFDKQLPIIIYKAKPPHRFSEEFIAGEFGRFCFSLSMAGLIPFSDKIESIRYQEEGPLKITSKNSYLFKVNFNKLIVFDDEGIEGLPDPQGKTSELYEVVDWINVRSGMRHGHERIKTTSDFVSCVHFYPTDRLDGHHPDRKDAAAVSYLTEEQLDEFGWSDSYVRLKVLEMMKLAGIKGQSSGTSNYALKIETALREVFPIGKNIYEPTDRLEFIYD